MSYCPTPGELLMAQSAIDMIPNFKSDLDKAKWIAACINDAVVTDRERCAAIVMTGAYSGAELAAAIREGLPS